jgi:large subunit ribosomal protein L25
MSKAEKKSSALVAATRSGTGKGVARALRREGKLPGILYGKGQKPISIALSANELTLEYQKGRFRSRLIDIALDGKTIQALPKDLQFNPVTDQIEHVDFIKIEKGMVIRVQVPVKFVGTDKSIGLKRGGVLNVVRHEIEFEVAPESIPTHIEVDVTKLDIGNSVHIEDISLPKGVTPTIKRNFTIAAVAGRSTADEEVKPAADAAAPAADAAAAGAAAAGAKKDEPKKDEKKK